jgi:hypothetical protein
MIYLLGLVIAFAAFGVWLAYRLGKNKAEKARAIDESFERAKDAEIASRPFVPNPAHRMRAPKD